MTSIEYVRYTELDGKRVYTMAPDAYHAIVQHIERTLG